MLKKYALFRGDNYYPYGGWKDLAGTFASIVEARLFHDQAVQCCWYHIIDLVSGEDVTYKG